MRCYVVYCSSGGGCSRGRLQRNDCRLVAVEVVCSVMAVDCCGRGRLQRDGCRLVAVEVVCSVMAVDCYGKGRLQRDGCRLVG